MAGGFKSLPQVTALIRRKPASARSLPATVPAADVQFDEDRRLILTEPLQPLPGAPVTVGPFGPSPKQRTIEWRNGPVGQKPPPGKKPIGPQWDPVTKTLVDPKATSTATAHERNGDGVWKSRRLRPGEIATMAPDEIPF